MERERKREGKRQKEGGRERKMEGKNMVIDLTGALAPFSYLVSYSYHFCMVCYSLVLIIIGQF